MSENESDRDPITNAQRLVYLAAERTLMSWIRTALGLMALGFVIDRFGLVLQHITTPSELASQTGPYSFWGGAILVLVGAAMALIAGIRFWHFSHEYQQQQSTRPGHGILVGVGFTVTIAVLGFAIGAFLLDTN